MSLNETTLLADFEMRSEAELQTLRDQARLVAFSFAKHISLLSQNTEFDREDAGLVLQVVNQVLSARAAGDGATDPLSLRPTMAHSVRFGGRYLTAP